MRVSLIAVFSGLMISGALADHNCGTGHDSLLIDKRVDKIQTGYVDFTAESRVQKFLPTARNFIWCIRNTHEYHVAEFMWGSPIEEDKYFHSIVEPGRESEAARTDSSAVRTSERQIKYRRLNTTSWRKYLPETIFFERIGERAGLLKLAQLSPPTSIDAGSLQVDLEKLSEDLGALHAFLTSEQKVQFEGSITATVPANKEAKNAIENQKYETYDRRDFARITIYLSNRLGPAPNGVSFADVSVGLTGVDDRAKDALRQVPVRVSVGSSDPKAQFLKVKMPWEFVAESPSKRTGVLSGPIDRLSYVNMSVVVSAADSNYVFASMPIRMLLPIAR